MGVSRRRIADPDGARALQFFLDRPEQFLRSTDDVALAVRYGLQLLGDAAPGKSVEVRVPPYGAAQVIEGPRHTRGTPPAVIELSPAVWLSLVCGSLSFAEAIEQGTIQASGLRADLLQGFLPLWPLG